MTRVTFDEGAKVRRIRANLQDPSKALAQVGVLMVAESQAAFRNQKFGDKKWDQRAPVNVFGVIADFHQGRKKPVGRRFDRRPALVDTGRGRKSIAFQVRGNGVDVGTNVDYMKVHQTGGKVESKPITKNVRRLLWSWLKNQGVAMKRRLGWLLNKKFVDTSIEGKVPPRPFIGVTKETVRNIEKVVQRTIMEVDK